MSGPKATYNHALGRIMPGILNSELAGVDSFPATRNNLTLDPDGFSVRIGTD